MGFSFSASVHSRALCVHLVAPSDWEPTDGRNDAPLPPDTFPLASGTGPLTVQLRRLVPQSRNVLLGWSARSISSGRGSTMKRGKNCASVPDRQACLELPPTSHLRQLCTGVAYLGDTPTGMGHVGP